ncbi:isatin hydrolase-like [Saccoglossus kowalevskii]|uniref:Uncharacterized protein LOC100372151 n=1 Tax=Saccoglossus kowalevskii TaxID=10224 RepID=A0ABM0GK43_SACKO|nr:PREDICTED: uncharacterized protein LOC100372151 [Saccoglossus kowalevskii]
MSSTTFSVVCFISMSVFYACVVQAGKRQILDMSYEISEDTPQFPGDPPFEFTILYREYIFPDTYLELNKFCAVDHIGTHMDAPSHFFEGGERIQDISLDRLIGKAVKIDIKAKADADSDAELTVADLQAWENDNGRIRKDSIVIVYTGWGSRYPDRLSYYGTLAMDGTGLHYPGIHPDAAQFLVDRKVTSVGIDTPSVDHGPSHSYATHKIFTSSGVIGLENVANVDQLPSEGATIYAIPLKIKDGSGSPSRIFAIWWPGNTSSGGNSEC